MHPTRIWTLSFLAVLLLFALPGAQAKNPDGALRGTVLGGSGARVPGAKIIASIQALSLPRETQASSEGEFLLPDLFPGSCQLPVSANGFADWASAVDVLVSSVRSVSNASVPGSNRQPEPTSRACRCAWRFLRARPDSRHTFCRAIGHQTGILNLAPTQAIMQANETYAY
jgi:hypothetical protein